MARANATERRHILPFPADDTPKIFGSLAYCGRTMLISVALEGEPKIVMEDAATATAISMTLTSLLSAFAIDEPSLLQRPS